MLKQAYRHKNQQPPLVPWLTPGASLIATSAFVLFVAGYIVAALMLVAVSVLICIFYFASWYVFNDSVPSNRALWVRVQSLAHIAFKQLQQFTDGHRLYVFQNQEYFFFNTGQPDLRLQNTVGSRDSCFQLWRERGVTDCLHNSAQGDLKGRCEHWEEELCYSSKQKATETPFDTISFTAFTGGGGGGMQISGLLLSPLSAFQLNCFRIWIMEWNMKHWWIYWFW